MNGVPSHLVEALAGQDFLPQEELPCEVMVCMEAYLLTCIQRELLAFYEGPNFLEGEQVVPVLL